jgi:hypothetical protein
MAAFRRKRNLCLASPCDLRLFCPDHMKFGGDAGNPLDRVTFPVGICLIFCSSVIEAKQIIIALVNLKPLFAISLIANLALAGVLVATLKSKPQGAAPSTASLPEVAPTKASEHTSKAETVIETVTNTVPAKAFGWQMVESDDYKKYIANLRSIGCPEETIRDIIIADVNKLYAAKLKELAGPKKKFEFWKSNGLMAGMMMDPERMEKERALNREKRALLTELLGVAPEEKADILAGAASQLETMFDFLPAEKRSKVFEAMQDMQAKMQKSMKGGAPDPDDIRKLMKESEATLAGILSPEELMDYNLRFSMTANVMRTQIAGFEPTEKEFLDIFKMRKTYDDEFGMGIANLSKAEKEQAEAAKKELNANLKETLGEDRYADYERAQDWNFQQINRIAEKNELGTTAAVRVYDMKKAAEDQAKKVRGDKSLDENQRTLALRGIRTETENSIRTVFGAKGWESYENNAWWLKNISPDPKPETK